MNSYPRQNGIVTKQKIIRKPSKNKSSLNLDLTWTRKRSTTQHCIDLYDRNVKLGSINLYLHLELTVKKILKQIKLTYTVAVVRALPKQAEYGQKHYHLHF